MIIVRYADDLIVGFEHESDARRFLDEMRKLVTGVCTVASSRSKTRLIEFGRFAAASRKRRGLGKPETFTFLDFTFICSKTRRGANSKSNGSPGGTACTQAKLQAIKQELRRSMHQPIPQQGRWLQQVVTGYFNYHAVPTNSSTLTAFLFHVTSTSWRRTLRGSGARKRLDDLGADSSGWPTTGSRNRGESFIRGQRIASPSDTQGGSRMPELGPYGSVRGARGNSRPYRESGVSEPSGPVLTLIESGPSGRSEHNNDRE